MKRSVVHALVLLSIASAACAVPSGGSPTQAPAPTSLATSAPGGGTTVPASPTPSLEAAFQDVTLIPGRLPGDWSVIGLLTNESSGAISGLKLEVGLFDANDAALARMEVTPALTTIGPGAQSPFTARFPAAGAADHARAEVVTYQPADQPPTPVEVGQLEAQSTEDGRIAVYGEAMNDGRQTVEIAELVVMATSSTGAPIALSDAAAGLSVLGPGESAPFVAVLATNETSAILSAFASARSAPEQIESPLSLSVPLRIEVDRRGSPLVIGTLHNDGLDWTTADIVVGLRGGDELMGLGELELPWPLAPGETQAFLLDEFPGLLQRMASRDIDAGNLTITSEIDPAGSQTTTSPPIALEASVMAQEVIEGTLFLKGTVVNGGSQELDRPSAVAVLRSTQGEVLSAGFVVAGPELEAGAALPFILTLPLPEGTDLAMAEFDLRACGFVPE